MGFQTHVVLIIIYVNRCLSLQQLHEQSTQVYGNNLSIANFSSSTRPSNADQETSMIVEEYTQPAWHRTEELNTTDRSLLPDPTAVSNNDLIMTPASETSNAGDASYLMAVSSNLEIYGGGFTVTLGLFGNLLSYVVLRRKRMRILALNTYLVVLAICDFLIILIGKVLRHWFRAITGVELLTKALWYCRMWYVIVPSLVMFSNWIIAGVSVERCIAICNPFLAKRMVRRWSSIIYLTTVFLIALAYYSYGIVFYDISYLQQQEKLDCNLMTDINPTFILSVRPWFEFVISSLIPATLIILCNMLIIVHFCRNNKNMKKNYGNKDHDNKQMKVMVPMLLTISFSFILLTTPLRVAYVWDQLYSADYILTTPSTAVKRLMWAISFFCIYLNHACNFLLYIISGSLFRQELYNVFSELCCVCVCTPRLAHSGSSAASSESSGSRMSVSVIKSSDTEGNQSFDTIKAISVSNFDETV